MRSLAKHTLAIWHIVVGYGRPVRVSELRDNPEALAVERASHRKIGDVVKNLTMLGYLSSDGRGVNRASYWFGENCKCPAGVARPQAWKPFVDSSVATARVFTWDGFYETEPIPMRPGAEDYRNYPSRVGDRLVYPDGRITRLNPDNTETVLRDADV